MFLYRLIYALHKNELKPTKERPPNDFLVLGWAIFGTKMLKNGQKWSKMVKNGPKWPKNMVLWHHFYKNCYFWA